MSMSLQMPFSSRSSMGGSYSMPFGTTSNLGGSRSGYPTGYPTYGSSMSIAPMGTTCAQPVMYAAPASPAPSILVPAPTTRLGQPVAYAQPPVTRGERYVGDRPVSREELAQTGRIVQVPGIMVGELEYEQRKGTRGMSQPALVQQPQVAIAQPQVATYLAPFASYPAQPVSRMVPTFNNIDRYGDGIITRSGLQQASYSAQPMPRMLQSFDSLDLATQSPMLQTRRHSGFLGGRSRSFDFY